MAESLPRAAGWRQDKGYRPLIDRHFRCRLIGDPEEEGVEGVEGGAERMGSSSSMPLLPGILDGFHFSFLVPFDSSVTSTWNWSEAAH